jgi:hypothetical protein
VKIPLYVIAALLLAALAGCAGQATSVTTPDTSASSEVRTPAGVAASPASASPVPVSEGGTELPATFWQDVGCVEATSCTPLYAERKRNSGAAQEAWCGIVRTAEGLLLRSYLLTDNGQWLEMLATRSSFESDGCTQAVAELERLATLPTPTPDLASMLEAIGPPLPPGALDIANCRPDGGCVAVLTEQPAGKDFLWCVVVERGGQRQGFLFLQNAPPQAATAEQFTTNGCIAAPAALKEGA